MNACHFLMLTNWFEEMIRNWLQLVWVNSELFGQNIVTGNILHKDCIISTTTFS